MSVVKMLANIILFLSVYANVSQLEELTVEVEVLSTAKLSVFGDIVIHDRINAEAMTDEGYDYAPFFDGVRQALSESDYSICTIETSFPDVQYYTGYPMFKTPGELATGLKDVGFDLINTASNHAMDGLEAGLYRTLDILDEQGLDHVGTYRSQEERDENNGIVVKDINGVSVAFMAYTYGTNGMDIDNFDYAVNTIFTDYKSVNPLHVDYEGLDSDLAAARALETDFIVMQLHWGYEYYLEPIEYQEQLSDYFFYNGVDIIVGSHPHVPQPMELREFTDIDGVEKTGFIVYSLGNFFANMDGDYEPLSACVDISLEKNNLTGEAYITHVSYKPLMIFDFHRFGIYSEGRGVKVCDIRAMMSGYESGEGSVLNEWAYLEFERGLENLHLVYDPAFDEVNGGIDVRIWDGSI